MLGVPGYAHDLPGTEAHPSVSAVSKLEHFERTLKNIEDLYVGVAVKWDSNPRGNRAANEANLGPGFIGDARNSKSVPFGVSLCL